MSEDDSRRLRRPAMASTGNSGLDRVLQALLEAIDALDDLEADTFRDAGFPQLGPDHPSCHSLPWIAALPPDRQPNPMFVRDGLVVIGADRSYEVRARGSGEILAEQLTDVDDAVRFADWIVRQPDFALDHSLTLERRAGVDQVARRLAGDAILRARNPQDSSRHLGTGAASEGGRPTRLRPASGTRIRPRRGRTT